MGAEVATKYIKPRGGVALTVNADGEETNKDGGAYHSLRGQMSMAEFRSKQSQNFANRRGTTFLSTLTGKNKDVILPNLFNDQSSANPESLLAQDPSKVQFDSTSEALKTLVSIKKPQRFGSRKRSEMLPLPRIFTSRANPVDELLVKVPVIRSGLASPSRLISPVSPAGVFRDNERSFLFGQSSKKLLQQTTEGAGSERGQFHKRHASVASKHAVLASQRSLFVSPSNLNLGLKDKLFATRDVAVSSLRQTHNTSSGIKINHTMV